MRDGTSRNPRAKSGAAGLPEGGRAKRLAALRRRVARIEGTLACRLEEDEAGPDAIALGVAPFDEALGGGIRPGLTELRLEETRDAGAGAGFALALAALAGASAARPFLWIGAPRAFAEAGPACRDGLAGFGLDPAACLLVEARRLEEAVWAGEEAARSGALSLALLEVRGNPGRLSLQGTRRLHLRAMESGTPFLILRQAGLSETSAAPLRLAVSPHPSRPEEGLAGGRFLGRPAFRVVLEKARHGRARQFLLEWNPDEQRFLVLSRAAAPHPGAVAAEALQRPGAPGAARPLVALRRAS